MKRFLVPLLLIFLSTLLAAAPAGAQSSELVFVEPQQLAVQYGGTAPDEATVWLKNASQGTVTPKFSALVEDKEGKLAKVRIEIVDGEEEGDSPAPLQAWAVGRYRVRLLEASESSGQLLASAPGLATAALPLSLKPELSSTRGVDKALVIPFGAALLLIVAVWIAKGPKGSLTGTLNGVTELDFSKSFASTLTGISALLGTIIAATGVLPEETTHLSRAALTGLNLTFGIAIVIAAAIANLAQAAEPVEKDGEKEWKVKGYVLPFLAGALITLWAVFGELWTIRVLIEELGGEKGVTSLAVTILRILLVVAAAAMIPYTLNRVKIAVQEPEPSPAPGAPPAGAPAQQPRRTETKSIPLL